MTILIYTSMTTYNDLTPEEERVILKKGTEAPFSGEYDDHFQEGTYICRRCSAPLYRSQNKFRSGCGWPSFDDALPGHVLWAADGDGRRTEITCANCGGHLGHVFVGEKLTEKNTRHCVNSLSMKFVSEIAPEPTMERATFGGGCFWCLEATFRLLKGVEEVFSGYMGGELQYPTYEQVTRGNTGHIEVTQVVFDPKIITYEQLLQVFFSLHNPTTKGRQGNDVGEQYTSVIFYHTDEQKKSSEEAIATFTKEETWPDPIVTEIRSLETFWIAEDYHQNYEARNPRQPYCVAIVQPKLAALRKEWAHLLKDA